MGNILTVASGKGGVSKTSTVMILSVNLTDQGYRVAVIDADRNQSFASWHQQAYEGPEFTCRSEIDHIKVVDLASELSQSHDVVLVDTAGRLQTQHNLQEELAKVGRVAARALDGGAFESLLVLDAVLGLSSLTQAREFNKAIPMTGLVLAKLDGSAKGGAVISIEAELDVPVKLAGVGEAIDDIEPFDPEAFVRALFEE